MVIRRIGVTSLIKMLGLLYFVVGLIVGAFMSLFALGTSALMGGRGGLGGFEGLFFGAGAIVILPIFYGVLGVVSGAITGALYNLFAGMVGGIEVQLEEKRAAGV